MKVIDRYILTEFLKAFLTLIVSFMLLFLIFDFSVNAGKFITASIPYSEILIYYAFLIPSLLASGLPMIMLLSLFWSMNRLNKYHEIAALQASGVSVFRICLPLLIAGLVLSLADYQVNEDINSRNARFVKSFMDQVKGHEKTDALHDQYYITDANSSMLWFREFDPGTSKMSGDIYWDGYTSRAKPMVSLVADSGEYIDGEWWLNDLKITRFLDGERVPDPHVYKRRRMYEWNFRPSELSTTTDFSGMRITSLRRHIAKYSETRPDMARSMSIELHNRFALPLMNITSLLLALPFAFRVRATRSVLAGIGVSFLLVFAYYGVYTLSIILGKHGLLVPWIVWFPNILFGSLGLLLFRVLR